MGETPFWGRFWEHPSLSANERTELYDLREQLYARLASLDKGPDGYGLIHADLHHGNLLVNGDNVRIIDFDDAGFGWHAYEFAVALAGQDPDRLQANLEAMVRGYRVERPVADETVALVPLFLVVRSLATIGWLMERPEHAQRAVKPLVKSAMGQAETLS